MEPMPTTSLAQPLPIPLAHPLLGSTLPLDQLYLGSYIGSGGFSVVFRGVQVHTGQEYAVKAIPFAPTGTPLNAQQKAEACLHSRASEHPNVVRLHKYFLHQHAGAEYLILVMDLVHGGDLHAMISAGRLAHRPQHLRHLFGQILDAVTHCHEKGIYHRDLSAENFLCTQDLAKIYLTDFGMAAVEPYYQHVGLGSMAYMSPEIHRSADPTASIHAPSTDVWALGVLLVMLLTGSAPWRCATIGDPDFTLFATDPSALFVRHRMPLPVEMLIRRALACNPGERISLSEFRAAFFLLDNEDLMLPRGPSEVPLAPAIRLWRASPGLISDSGSADSSESATIDTPSGYSSQNSSVMLYKLSDF
ncbi:unnamed protein product [Peniophora sp. CBMAI 1063]|nr:unnamed protein product [Peniophora sp. CBMAI 1063]